MRLIWIFACDLKCVFDAFNVDIYVLHFKCIFDAFNVDICV